MNNPACKVCGHRFAWSVAIKRVLGPRRPGAAFWGTACPGCSTELRVPTSRVLLIATAGIFFGSQSSTLLLLGEYSPLEFWIIKLALIIGFYAIAVFFLFDLEPLS